MGGFDLAARRAGWDNLFQCEIDDFCRKVLRYHFKDTILHGDIRETDFKQYRGRVDIITSGTPCQPASLAGKRRGEKDDRYLWPEFIRCVREARPRWVIGENVLGLTSLVQPLDEAFRME